MSEMDPSIERCAEDGASLTLDLRHAPLIVVTWIGAPTLGMLDALQARLDRLYARAREGGTSGLVMISDATAAAVPSHAVRRRLAELRHDFSILLTLIAVVPSNNVLLRGVLTGIRWVLSDNRRFTVATSFEHALEISARTFERHGLSIPEQIEQLRAAL